MSWSVFFFADASLERESHFIFQLHNKLCATCWIWGKTTTTTTRKWDGWQSHRTHSRELLRCPAAMIYFSKCQKNYWVSHLVRFLFSILKEVSASGLFECWLTILVFRVASRGSGCLEAWPWLAPIKLSRVFETQLGLNSEGSTPQPNSDSIQVHTSEGLDWKPFKVQSCRPMGSHRVAKLLSESPHLQVVEQKVGAASVTNVCTVLHVRNLHWMPTSTRRYLPVLLGTTHVKSSNSWL